MKPPMPNALSLVLVRGAFRGKLVRQHKPIRMSLVILLGTSPLAALIAAPAVWGVIGPLALVDLGASMRPIAMTERAA